MTSPTRPIDLEIRITTPWGHEGRSLEYVLSSPSGVVPLFQEKVSGKEVNSPGSFQNHLFQQLERLHLRQDVDGGGILGEEVFDDLTTLGYDLYQQLFSREMQMLYRELRSSVATLLIVSDEPWIPWEILRPHEFEDDDFLCMQFQMSRWFTGETPLIPDKQIQRLVCIDCLSDEESIDAEREGERLREIMERTEGLDGLFESEVTAREFEEILELESFDLLHFVGHGEHDETRPGEASILLADRPFRLRQVPPVAEKKLRGDCPVVFINACQIGRSDQSLTGMDGWAPRWVTRCGCCAFLAPFWSVNSVRASRFAELFYEGVMEGRLLGEAVLTARHRLREENRHEMAWLAYSLYGHPSARISFGIPQVELLGRGQAKRKSVLLFSEPRWYMERSSPGALVRTEYEVVPFHFRKKEVEDLVTWCRFSDALGVRLYTGPSGMGKGRLAREVCRRLREEGWQAGPVDMERQPEDIWGQVCKTKQPRLFVIDHAETQRSLLTRLLREISRGRDEKETRILLLAQAAPDWWEELKGEGPLVGEVLSSAGTSVCRLEPLALSTDDRIESYKIAAQSFSERLGRELPVEIPDDLDAEPYSSALVLHMRALVAVDGVRLQCKAGEEGILAAVLDRERAFWERLAVKRRLGKEIGPGIGQIMAAITLGGGAKSFEAAVSAMSEMAFFQNEERSVLRTVARLLHEAYSGPEGWIEPLKPDLLGGHLILHELEQSSAELLDLVLGPAESSWYSASQVLKNWRKMLRLLDRRGKKRLKALRR